MTTAQANVAPLAARRARSIGKLSIAAVLLLVIAVGSLGWAVWQLRVDARRDAYEETGNLALVLAGQLSRFLQTIDVVLAESREAVPGGGAGEGKAEGTLMAPRKDKEK